MIREDQTFDSPGLDPEGEPDAEAPRSEDSAPPEPASAVDAVDADSADDADDVGSEDEAGSAVPAAAVIVNGDAEESSDEGPPEEDGPPEGEADPEVAARELESRLEAILFSSEIPLPVRRLVELGRRSKREVLAAVDRLNVFYAETERAFRISELAGGFQLVTTPEHGDLLLRLHKDRVPTRLSRAALETLSIIAFKQPVTRAEIDAIRGVSASDRVLRHLIERKLAKISGRAEAPGRPLLYGTTREFLSYFGLAAVNDLPRTPELAALLAGDRPRLDRDEDDDEIGSDDPTLDQYGPAQPSHSGEESGEAHGTSPS